MLGGSAPQDDGGEGPYVSGFPTLCTVQEIQTGVADDNEAGPDPEAVAAQSPYDADVVVF
jgi:hypothetical protein